MGRTHWVDRLSAYVDEELSEGERAACAAHVAECRECATTLDDLRALTARASLLPGIPPERDLWPGIEARLEPRSGRPPARSDTAAPAGVLSIRPTRWTLTVPQLVAAAIALVVLAAGSVWLLVPSAGLDSVADPTPATAPGVDGSPQLVFLAAYQPAISELEREFQARRAQLAPDTRRVVEENMAIIDQAIAEAERALAEDPSNSFLNTHLAGTMRQKVELLRRATTIQSLET